MFNASNTNPGMIIQQVQAYLMQIRDGMTAAQYLHDFTSAISLTDLTTPPPDGPGMIQADAQGILDAAADAWGHMQLYQTGTDDRHPPVGYAYGASQKRVISSARTR